jgi:replicative DNA helicase
MGVHVFSQEDGWRTCADRTISRFSQIGVNRLRKLELVDADVAGLRTATAKAHSYKNLLIDNRAGLSAPEIIRSVRRHKANIGTKLVVVDYWQIVRRSRHLGDNENGALDEIITAFSHAAKQDDVAYLVLSQLNRKVEERTDRRPGMSDIRGSGSGEERAKVIVSPYRGSYYYDLPKPGIDCDCSDVDSRGKPTTDHDAGCFHVGKDHSDFEQHAQVLILKDNNGQSGARVWASWRGPTTEMW